jgi:hypothetical protein
VNPPPAALAIAAPTLVERSSARPTEHPLEACDRLAWQATAAVGLLERFGDLVLVALEAAGDGDDELLRAALTERQRLLSQLEPLLADLSGARQRMSQDEFAGPNARHALATILHPVDQALRYANVLHVRLTDELPERAVPVAPARPARRAPLALVR